MFGIDPFVAVALGGVLLLAAIALYFIVRRLRAGEDGVVGTADDVPAFEAIELALQPYILRAILAGERAMVWGINDFKTKLAGIDKKHVADSFYALLPDLIMVGSVPVPLSVVKKLVSADDFYRLIKDAYDAADAFIVRNEVYLRSQVDAFKAIVVG